jgi:hypothetical protein
MSLTGEQRGIVRSEVERTACKIVEVRTEEELRDSEDVVVVTVVFSAGLGSRWKRDGRVLRVDEPTELVVVFSAGLVAGWKRVLREWLVDEPTKLVVLSRL